MVEEARIHTKVQEPKQKCSNLCKRSSGNNSSGSSADRILQLQKTMGNQAVQRLIKSGALQAKLRIGQPNDIYEQEADKVAEQVMRMPDPILQRQKKPEEEKEEIVQTKSLVNHITPLVQRRVDEKEKEEERIQRKEASTIPFIQRVSLDPVGSFEPGADFEAQLNSSSGSPLPSRMRAFMEPRFSADFNEVKLHSDSKAAQLNRSIGAQAFTHGRDIYLGEGKSDLESSAGKQLIAHELAHTIQQGKRDTLRVALQSYGLAVADISQSGYLVGNKAAQASGTVMLQSVKRPEVDQHSQDSGMLQLQSATRDQLISAFRNSLARQDWSDSAVRLNGFSDDDIELLVGRMSFGQLAHVREAAVIVMPGWSSRVTDAIDRADANAKRIASYYAQYEAAVAAAKSGRGGWDAVSKLLNGMGDWDLADRLKRFTWFELMKIKDAAEASMPGFSARVVKAVEKTDLERVKRVYQAYEKAVSNQDWTRAAAQLNGFSDDDIKQKIDALADSEGGIRKLGHLKAAAIRLMPDHYGRVVKPIDEVLAKMGVQAPDIIPYQESIPIPDVSDDTRLLEGTSLEGFGGNAKVENYCRKLAALYGNRMADKQLDDDARKAAVKERVLSGQLDEFIKRHKAERTEDRKTIAEAKAKLKLEQLSVGFVSTGPVAQSNMGYKTFAGYAKDWMSEMREMMDAETTGITWYGKFRLPKAPAFETKDLVDIIKPGEALGTTKVHPFVNEFIAGLSGARVHFKASTYPNHGGKAWAPFCLDVNPVIERDERGLYLREPAYEFLEQVNAVINALKGDWASCYNDATLCDYANKRFGTNRLTYAGSLGTGNWHGALKLHFHFYLVPPTGAPGSASSGPIINPANEPSP